MLKIKDNKGKIIGVLKDEDTEPSIDVKDKGCPECDGTGWIFKDRNPPFPKCPKCISN